MTKIDRQEIKKFVTEYVERNSPLPDGVDKDSFNFVGNGYVDSIDFFSFILFIKHKYLVEFSDEELVDVKTSSIGGLTDLIVSKLEKKNEKN